MFVKLIKAQGATSKTYTAKRNVSLKVSRNRDIFSMKIPDQNESTLVDLGGAEGIITVDFDMVDGDTETGVSPTDIISQLSFLYDYVHGQSSQGGDKVQVWDGSTMRAEFIGKFVGFEFSWITPGSPTTAKCSIKLLVGGQIV
jgi:hypothetical protein